MIDLHAHILPGVDDGVGTIEEARDVARAASAEGVTVIAATPHVRSDYATAVEVMEAGVADLRADLAREGLGVDVVHGGEISFDWLNRLSDEELERFSFAQNGRYLLVEPPYSGWPLGLGAQVAALRRRGLTAILAHPERNGAVRSSPDRLTPLVAAGALVQLTAGSLTGAAGRATREIARLLIDRGLAHLIASDVHGPATRPYEFAAGAAAIHDDALRRWLVEDVPAAIVAGVPPPNRPTRRRRFRLTAR